MLRIFINWTLRAAPFAALAVLFSSAAICHSQATAPPLQTPPQYRQITDEIGRTIRLPQSIHRIVSLAPNITETIYALGLQDHLVGDTDYCDFPAEAQQKTKVGGAVNPSIEAIAALAGLEHQLSVLHERIASLPPRRVLFIVWTEPLISIGNDTFIADALRHAGAVSVIDSSQNWPQVNLEEVVRLQPEFLIFVESHSGAGPHSADALTGLPGWRLLNAVRNRRYATISDAINRPAPRLVSAVEDLARQLHPEVFTEGPQNDKEQAKPPAPALSPRPNSSLVRNEHNATSKEQSCAR